ncbi:hypothetical protein INT44_001665 [Umbelopsis vinacea]|uniref:Uncharacterized protein n=1 Tax=Umbelopsis vinacea TaxID=44442 RepID=A0A8H7PRE1_9FUNG|nr:hypothetical protein INT44_001665 [Umbelopsis vinacea]
MTNDVTPNTTTVIVDDADLLAILADDNNLDDTTTELIIQPTLEFLLSPNLPELQSDDEGSELSLTLLDDAPSRKRSREDFEEDDADPFGFELLDVIQLEDPPHLAKKPFVNDEELSLDFLDDFESNPEIVEPFITV